MFLEDYLDVNDLKEGEAKSIHGINYIMKNGVLRQNKVYSEGQSQTKDAFGFKWGKRETYESEIMRKSSLNWMIERYFGGKPEIADSVFFKGSKILDAGCGSGFSALLILDKYLNSVNYLGVDISSSVDVAAERFKENGKKGKFLQCNILELPFVDPTFDIIFSEGVLHHTDSTEKALKYLSKLLVKGGRFLFYVYKKKAPIREFNDDFIREYIKPLSDEEAWEALIPLSKLGQTLGSLNIEIDVPEDIPYLEIPKGKIDLQRFFYWYIFKAYYRPDFNLDEINHINFDWYRPHNCHRQTAEEIRKWCSEAGLRIERLDEQEAGITVVAIKQ